jgi:hypothetical protein
MFVLFLKLFYEHSFYGLIYSNSNSPLILINKHSYKSLALIAGRKLLVYLLIKYINIFNH